MSIEDVAKRAKVSISTVSRVINKSPTVSKRNQARVEEAIAFLKYKPNVSAQRLARGMNNAVGLVMPGYPGIFHSFYAIEIIRGVGHACETLRLDLVFHITNGDNPINTNAVGGVIFADVIENRKQVDATVEAGIPCVIINNVAKGVNADYIGIDNVSGADTATEYLLNLGHKRVAHISGNLTTQAGEQRAEGYKKALKNAGMTFDKSFFIEGDYSRRSARIATEQLLGSGNKPTAIFAASDEMALEVIAVAIEHGLRVPDDISVVGFDDNPQAIYGPVALTTVNQPLFQIAEESVKHLNGIITGKKKGAIRKTLVPELVIRESCCPPQ